MREHRAACVLAATTILLFGLAVASRARADFNAVMKSDPDLSAEKTNSKALTAWQCANSLHKPYSRRALGTDTVPHVAASEEEYRICIIGDTGNGSAGQKAVADELNHNCDEVRHVGDIVYYTGTASFDDPRFEARFAAYYDSVSVPFHIALGNHDYYQDPDQWVGLDGTHSYRMPAAFYADTVAVGGQKLCFVTLDSTPFDAIPDSPDDQRSCLMSFPLKDWESEAFKFLKAFDVKSESTERAVQYFPRTREQLAWITKIKSKLTGCNATFSLMHHPVEFAKPGRGASSSLGVLYRKLETDLGLSLAISGHDHYLAAFSNIHELHREGDRVGLVRRTGRKEIPEILSGSGGMLQLGRGTLPERTDYLLKAYQRQGYVIMTVKTPTETIQPLNIEFRFRIFSDDDGSGNWIESRPEGGFTSGLSMKDGATFVYNGVSLTEKN